jgi:hypothetical protein
MPNEALFDPVNGREVPTVDDAIAVGEDLAFQERWWVFERVVWCLFIAILVADVLGVFGRGWLAKAELKQPGSGIRVEYERVERNGTPSIMRVHFDPGTVADGKVRLFASESLVRELGAQRIIPQPEQSILSDGGLTYVFPAQGPTPEIQFQLDPSFPGYHQFTLQVPGEGPATAHIGVLP